MTSKLDPCRTEEPEGGSMITPAEALPSDDGVSTEKKKEEKHRNSLQRNLFILL